MKFRTTSWEEGTTAINDEPCVMATVECIPNWFMRTFLGKKPYFVDVYGEKNNFGWQWFYAATGHEVEHYYMDDSSTLHSHLCSHRHKLDRERKARAKLLKIKHAKKC